MENLSIKKDDALKAYSETDENGRKLLENLFGKEFFKFDYRTIISYEAACKRNGETPRTDWGDLKKDEIAYIKLKEIMKAINDDPEFPRFTAGEWRHFPRIRLYTQKEVGAMSDEQKNRVVWLSYRGAYAGLGGVHPNYAPSGAHASIGSRLCFKEKDSATFSGNQHVELWVDFLFKAE